ncbi:hypothetical protein ACIA7S_28825 [Streptomyces sp. NPDC051643]|uniref:hypothetical protein n=1 Tax=Streptomyces sp. NPDC051643 TaxID=3365665 RepID=UPI0037B824CF
MSPHTPTPIPTSDLSTDQIQQIIDDIRFSLDNGTSEHFTRRYPELIKQAEVWQAEQAAAVYPVVPAAAPVPYVGPGVAPLQQVLLPDGRVVTGYSMAPAAPAAPGPVERRGGVDPLAQRLAAAGVLAAGVGWGGSLLLDAVAAAETGLVALAVCLVVVWAMRKSGGGVRVDVRVSPTINATATATSHGRK